MPSSSANFSAGMILPRAMPAMSGMMASTSEMPWSLQELLDLVCSSGSPDYFALFARRPGRTRRTARVKTGCSMTFHSGCHCTASAKLGAVCTRKASTSAVRRARLDRRGRGAERSHALRVQRIHLDAVAAREPAQHAAPAQLDLVRRAVLHVERLLRVLAMVVEARRPRAASGAACRRRRRSSPGSRGRRRTPASPLRTARGISGSVVASRCGSCSVPGRARRAARSDAAPRSTGCPVNRMPSKRREQLAQVERSPERGDQHRQASAAWTTAAMYFSPTQWNGCEPNRRRSAGIPMTGLRMCNC